MVEPFSRYQILRPGRGQETFRISLFSSPRGRFATTPVDAQNLLLHKYVICNDHVNVCGCIY